MSKAVKLFKKVMSGASDHNIMFDKLTSLLDSLGFIKRIKGSHHIFYKNDMEEIINVQPKEDRKAKAYQVRQIRGIIMKYNLKPESL